jgi:cytosine/adenosine deaminase-related metal-dependent hydrolase
MKLAVDDYLDGSNYEPGGPAIIEINEGLVVSIDQASLPTSSRIVAIPALINAHDHARPISATALGGAGRPLETWLPRLAVLPAADPYLAALCAFGRSARGGCAGTMVHLTRPMGRTPLPDEAVAITKAAGDIGISIALAVSLRDMNPLVYGNHSDFLANVSPALKRQVEGIWLREPADWRRQLALVEEVDLAVRESLPLAPVNVQLGPNGLQWCSRELLKGIAEASALSGRRVHMHFLETLIQREWMDREYPDGAVKFMKEIGLLSPRLTLAHCVWARPNELEMIAESGARIAVNPSSNLALFSGIAPAGTMHQKGIELCLGLDGCALDEDDDALREMRLLRLLNAGTSFDAALRGSELFSIACNNGRKSIGLDGMGAIQEGGPADIVLLALDRINPEGVMEVDLRDLLFSRGKTDHIQSVIVRGRKIVDRGRVLGTDLDAAEKELIDFYRIAIGNQASSIKAWNNIEPLLVEFNRGLTGCN